MSVCPSFESNIRQNGWSNWAQFSCGTWHDPRYGLWMIKMSKISLHQNSIFMKLWKSRNKLFKLFLLLSYILNKEKMLTMEAPWNPSNLNKARIQGYNFEKDKHEASQTLVELLKSKKEPWMFKNWIHATRCHQQSADLLLTFLDNILLQSFKHMMTNLVQGVPINMGFSDEFYIVFSNDSLIWYSNTYSESCKSFVRYVHILFVYVLTAYGCT